MRESAKTHHYLRHEQLHFDITELFARKLRKFLSQREYKCDEVEELEEIITVFLDEWRDLQKKYDLETHYSLSEGMQENWMKYVDELMTYYEDY